MYKVISRVPFHPLLFAIYPILHLSVKNLKQIPLSDPLRSLAVTIILTGVLYLGFRLILKDWGKSALVCTLMLVLFFSFGHAANQVENWVHHDLSGKELDLLGWAWLVLFILFACLVMKAKQVKDATLFLNVLGIVFVLVTLGSAVPYALSVHQNDSKEVDLLARLRGGGEVESVASTTGKVESPDIYYIVLDAYERADKLEEYYHFDNSAFIDALKERGFYVANESRSNYLTTVYSVPSSLNLMYLNDLPASTFVKMTSSLRTNYVDDFLKANGYQTVRFETGFKTTDAYDAGYTVSPTAGADAKPGLNSFELLLFDTSLGRLVFTTGPAPAITSEDMVASAIRDDFNVRRQRIRYNFSHLADFAAKDGSYFLFAHIVAPHNPYIWEADGDPIAYNGEQYLLGDKLNTDRDIQLYTGQLQYVNILTLEAIDRILENSNPRPVIILQADHGHDTFFEWDAPTPEGLDLRTATLNAVYFPDEGYEELYPSITPVNTFRVVFNHFFGTKFPLLPDKMYGHGHPNTVPANAKPDFVEILPDDLAP